MKKCIILANGKPPKKSEISFIMRRGYDKLICADGGANAAAEFGLLPDYIIGDLDSIRPDVYNFFNGKCRIMRITRQTDTDVEKCIKFLIKQKYDEVLLIGATGDRLDHTFCNLGIVLKYFSQISIRILHQKSLLSAHSGKVLLKTCPAEVISIYGIESRTTIQSKGLKYPLKNIHLPFGVRESTSNVSLGDQVELTVKRGIVLVIRNFDLMRKHDLF
jgi:thiamine pyrophosphokinase